MKKLIFGLLITTHITMASDDPYELCGSLQRPIMMVIAKTSDCENALHKKEPYPLNPQQMIQPYSQITQ